MAFVHGSLFRKYLIILFAAVVAPLLIGAVTEAWFSYNDHRNQLSDKLRLQTESAAHRIEAFVNEIRDQLGWVVQLPWTARDDEQRVLDATRLLRQAPAIISVTQVDGSGHERAFVSRRTATRSGRGADLSHEVWFTSVVDAESKAWFGDVRYERNSEPFMFVAVVGNRRASGAAVAYVNLKFIWDVVAAIRIGETGNALVIDGAGRLIAHPNLSLVLRGDSAVGEYTKLKAALANSTEGAVTTVDAKGASVVAIATTIPRLGWTVIAEQPYGEAFASIRYSLLRSLILIAIGSLFAVFLAYWLARRMSEPIHRLGEGAKRIGAGEFGHRVSIATGDELETLANQFNTMAGELRESAEKSERIGRLRRFLAPQVAELVEDAGNERLLDGQRREVVVIFGDLRGFTNFSSQVGPETIMSVLGEYLEAVGAVVTRNGATLTNFAGDGVMILVNAPVERPLPARLGLQVATELQNSVQALILQWREKGYKIGFGVGVAMGSATVGKIGYEGRLDYTAIGSVVNLASRLCSAAKDTEILVDEVLADASDKSELENLGGQAVKGYDQPVPVFRVTQ
jgi:adenylate cyclase